MQRYNLLNIPQNNRKQKKTYLKYLFFVDQNKELYQQALSHISC